MRDEKLRTYLKDKDEFDERSEQIDQLRASGLPAKAAEAFVREGTDPNKIQFMSDEDIMAIRGIGKGFLIAIREMPGEWENLDGAYIPPPLNQT